GARINHDQLSAFTQALLHTTSEHRVAVGRIGADHHQDVGVLDGVEVLSAGGGAERGLEAVTRRRVAHARASVDVVHAKAGPDQLLHQEGFLVGAARGGNATHGILAVLVLDALELGRNATDGLLPCGFTPRIGDLVAHHRLQDALLVGGIAPSEASLDAGMPAIGLAVLEWHHAHALLAAHLCLKGAANAAVGASGDDRMFGLADFDHSLLGQRGGGAGLHTGAAGHAFAL